MNVRNPLRAIRLKCMDCAALTKMVAYCTCDGFNSTRCDLWPYRFGCRPATASKRHGKQFVTPRDMPDPNTPIDDLDWPLRGSAAATDPS